MYSPLAAIIEGDGHSLADKVMRMWGNIVGCKREAASLGVSTRFYQCPATVSVLGAMAAQEVVKACTHSYTPLSQLYISHPYNRPADSSRDLRSPVEKKRHTFSSKVNDEIFRSIEAEKLYGSRVATKLNDLRVFVIGVGAIGCEVLKILQQMGVGQSPAGSVTITDPDFIERSNLNRQLFFRECDVGLSKANTAAKYLRNNIGQQFNVTPLTLAVSVETEDVFTPDFWNKFDIVITALDSVQARQYVDKQCVQHGLWMIDAGTTGLKGSTQVIVPHVSESYASLDDVAEKDIPVCTLKMFPHKVRVTLW